MVNGLYVTDDAHEIYKDVNFGYLSYTVYCQIFITIIGPVEFVIRTIVVINENGPIILRKLYCRA